MFQKLEKIIKVEWKAQELQHKFENSGPLIEPLITIIPDNIRTQEGTPRPSNYLIIQGSFDPPTMSHLELITKAIDLRLNINPLDSIEVVILLSLSHVDKKFNVLNRSILGYRVEMLENLLKNLMLNIPITIGLSNVARYIDLIKAAKQSFKNIKTLSFIMGMDVFNKIFDPNYYSKPIEKALPMIFDADYFVAGRQKVFSKKDFSLFLNKHLPSIFHKKIYFLTMPKGFRFLNATLIREKYSKKQPIQEASIHPVIQKHLVQNNLYFSTSGSLAKKIAIQKIIQLTLESGNKQLIAIEILKYLLPEIDNDALLQQKLINEYKTDENSEISKRWDKLLKLIS
ncbi:MAG: hypothetical protein ACXADY_15870 [Candidatus Hodarchaeales archaeon]